MGNKRTYQKRGTTDRRKTGKAGVRSDYKDEIVLLVLLLASILILLSVFNVCGKVGEWLGGFLFGMLGVLAYPFPFFLFFACALYRFNPSNRTLRVKLFSGSFLYLCLISLVELLSGRGEDVSRILDYYVMSSETRLGGGLLGGLTSHALAFLFGEIGALAVLLVLSMICFVILTGKLFLSMLREKTMEHIENRKMEREAEEEEWEGEEPAPEEGRKRKAKMVTFAKKPKKEQEVGDMVEIKPIRTEEAQPPTEGEAEVQEEDRRDVLENLTIERPKEPAIEVLLEEEVKTTRVERKSDKDEFTPEAKEEMMDELSSESSARTTIPYQFPTTGFLTPPKRSKKSMSDRELKDTAYKIQTTLASFGVQVKVSNISCGPSVTRYEVQPDQGVKISKITSLSDDIKLNLAAADIRIEAPIPGKSAVGIEVPNRENATVFFREMIESEEFKSNQSNLAFSVGKDIGGNAIISDISKMPHMLIAGSTGSGKSVCINSIVMSLLYKANPNDVKLIMVDPKVVELNVYNGIPHLLLPVVTDPHKAAAALNWAVVEMERRYKQFAELGVRDIGGYNKKIEKNPALDGEQERTKMPKIVIIVDELSDLMMVASKEVEGSICRLAQMARAAGLHLILATQRPSVNVITGLIKANVPSRIAFAVSSYIDSRTILDGSGAEKLLGKGDMLFFPSGYPKPVRVQGNYVSDKEVEKVVEFVKSQYEGEIYDESITETITSTQKIDLPEGAGIEYGEAREDGEAKEGNDPYFNEIGRFIIEKEKASIGLLQRVFRIGFNRAARIMDQLCEAGVVGPEEGTKPRKIIMTMEEFEQMTGSRKEP